MFDSQPKPFSVAARGRYSQPTQPRLVAVDLDHRVRGKYFQAFRKKSDVPKLPDLSASAKGRAWAPACRATVQGTPGPMRRAFTPMALTTAPDVFE
jgi:hypothetical protein